MFFCTQAILAFNQFNQINQLDLRGGRGLKSNTANWTNGLEALLAASDQVRLKLRVVQLIRKKLSDSKQQTEFDATGVSKAFLAEIGI